MYIFSNNVSEKNSAKLKKQLEILNSIIVIQSQIWAKLDSNEWGKIQGFTKYSVESIADVSILILILFLCGVKGGDYR